MKWEKEKIILSDSIEVEAQVPVIISASRATTDTPELLKRIKNITG